MSRISYAGVLLVAGVMAPTMAAAYIGPGAGLGAIGTLIALVGAVLLAIVGFVWYPVKRMLRARRAGDAPSDPSNRSD